VTMKRWRPASGRTQPDPAWGSLGREGRGRVAPTDGGLRAVQQAVLRAFAVTGLPPTTAELRQAAAPDGADPDHVLARLDAEDFLRLDSSGQISAAYPFSAVATAHRVRIAGGPEVFAMCAIDALGIAPMLEAAVVIHSTDPSTDQPITVTHGAANSAGPAMWEPATAVVFSGQACGRRTGPAMGSAADVCCGYVNFFASAATAAAWAKAHPQVTGQILDHANAERLGAHIFGPLLTAAS
jgi:hypothetical protein